MWPSAVPVVLMVIIAITIIGNIFVVVAFFRDARIRSTVANIFILNLAITDLSVGTVVMTLNLVDIIIGHWLFGETFCKLWSTFEFTLTLMSTLTMLLISWDRYCLLTMGMAYKTYQTRKRIGITLAICWVACLIFYATFAFAWEAMFGKSSIDFSTECEMEFLTNLPATIAVNVVEFVVPFTVLLIMNVLVYSKIKGRSVGMVGIGPMNNLTVKPLADGIDTIIKPIPVPDGAWKAHESVPDSTKTVSPKEDSTERQRRDEGYVNKKTPVEHVLEESKRHDFRSFPMSVANGNTVTITSPLPKPVAVKTQTHGTSSVHKAKGTLSKHRKAALVLIILSGCYFLCFTPYNILSIVYAICKFECANGIVWEVVSYLLWCNSAINPFIYAATNVHFRRNFRQFLFLDRWRCDLKGCNVKSQSGNTGTPSLAETEHNSRQ